jgi:glucose/arabinose dehydrogenase
MRVMRAKFDTDSDALTETRVLFEGTPGPRPEQIGGRLALTGDGYLFISLGDRWEGQRAQDLSDTAGSIVRIKTDGSIPDDNPFRNTQGARPEIWSYGHRNRKASPSTAPPASSGPTSTGRKAATSLI